MPLNIIIFGATGSIGTSTLNIIRRYRSEFNVVGIAANANIDKLASIAKEFNVKNVEIFDKASLNGKENLFVHGTNFFFGENGLCELAKLQEADSILMAIVGTAGIRPTISAIENGKNILLASKEVLVVAGKFVMESARKNGVKILPVDSEHNAIFQCLRGNNYKEIDKLILTASGGAFRNLSKYELENVTVEQALKHPTWNMGQKITIDSSTLANKGLEIIEARWLFDVENSQIEVIGHPESIIHSMVKFLDGSVIAQMCPTSMEYPISNCIFYPKRKQTQLDCLDFAKQKSLTFFEPDIKKFPCLKIARDCLNSENNACAVFQVANEIAVDLFLKKEIKFTKIPEIIASALEVYSGEPMTSLENCLQSVEKTKALFLHKQLAI